MSEKFDENNFKEGDISKQSSLVEQGADFMEAENEQNDLMVDPSGD